MIAFYLESVKLLYLDHCGKESKTTAAKLSLLRIGAQRFTPKFN